MIKRIMENTESLKNDKELVMKHDIIYESYIKSQLECDPCRQYHDIQLLIAIINWKIQGRLSRAEFEDIYETLEAK